MSILEPSRADEAAAFIARPQAAAAVALRRYDDLAKDPAAVVPDLDHFLPILYRLAKPVSGSMGMTGRST